LNGAFVMSVIEQNEAILEYNNTLFNIEKELMIKEHNAIISENYEVFNESLKDKLKLIFDKIIELLKKFLKWIDNIIDKVYKSLTKNKRERERMEREEHYRQQQEERKRKEDEKQAEVERKKEEAKRTEKVGSRFDYKTAYPILVKSYNVLIKATKEVIRLSSFEKHEWEEISKMVDNFKDAEDDIEHGTEAKFFYMYKDIDMVAQYENAFEQLLAKYRANIASNLDKVLKMAEKKRESFVKRDSNFLYNREITDEEMYKSASEFAKYVGYTITYASHTGQTISIISNDAYRVYNKLYEINRDSNYY
jgi:hypothetical protein